ncbi:hypothetical protein BZA77DRAFT_291892 [Pyronema omphalodes]|nr:hypothetical protein BZA77DRAFT_296879 [Pyronema omphalodes]KAI5817963.1 hypothetical protein BZA77DRAFT_291892 [Pyronema omphalodes]
MFHSDRLLLHLQLSLHSTSPTGGAKRLQKTSDLGNKGRRRTASAAEQRERKSEKKKGTLTKIASADTAPNATVTKAGPKKQGGHPVTKPRTTQPPAKGIDEIPASCQGRLETCRAKRMNQQFEVSFMTTFTGTTSLTTCPTEILDKIIGFLQGAERATRRPDLFNLRLANRRFSFLLQPIIYESVWIPRKQIENPSVTNDVRQLLRLIDRNPSLAACIKELSYYDPFRVMIKPVKYDTNELQHDHRIFSQFAEELAQTSSTVKTFDLSLEPSKLTEISLVYDKACAAILLSKLTKLRRLTFHGFVGGKYSFLLTQWAKGIWKWMPPQSLELLHWQPNENEYEYQQWELSETHGGSHNLDDYIPKQPKNLWNVVSFLRYAPNVQQLSIVEDSFLIKATPKNMPVLQFLTVIDIQTMQPGETSQCILELLKCSPMLQTLRCNKLHFLSFKAPKFKRALRLVRNTIEEIHIYGEFEGDSGADGGIGSFRDFPKLRTLSTDVTSLIPSSPHGCPEDFSLLELLPPTLESLHIFDTVGVLSTKPLVPEQDSLYSGWYLIPISQFYKLLGTVALAKATGLENLTSMSTSFGGWIPSALPNADEDTEQLAAICHRMGIKWKFNKLKPVLEGWHEWNAD